MLVNFIAGWALLSIIAVVVGCCLVHNGLSEVSDE